MDLSESLAAGSPDLLRHRLGIHELLVNAIEHGNLGIGFEAKSSLLRQGRWEEEIARRSALPELKNREVRVALSRRPNKWLVHISDEGDGFDWQKKYALTPSKKAPNGRGLSIVKACAFSDISYNRKGNAVSCVVVADH